MNILVCLSRVPDTSSKIEVSEDKKSINTANLKYIMNPYDEYALEEALLIRSKLGGYITALTVGGDSAKDILRSAYALSVDKCVLIKINDSNSADTDYIAAAIADYARNQSFDLILCGRQSIDYSSEAVPIFLSEYLNVPAITVATKIEFEGNDVTANKELENGSIKMQTTLPCIISVQKGINQPRYPKLPDIMKSKSKNIQEYNVQIDEPRTNVAEIETKQKSRIGKVVGSSQEEIKGIIDLLKNDAKVL